MEWYLLWIELCHQKKSVEILTLVCINVILLGNRIFAADVIKLRWSDAKADPKPMADVLKRRENRHTETYRKKTMWRQVEIFVHKSRNT